MISAIKRRLAYRIWKKILGKYGGFNKRSSFKLLEVGCGPGYFLLCMEKWFPKCDLAAVDIDEGLVQFSSKSCKRAKIIMHDGQSIPFMDNTFDVVCSLQVIEHIKDPELFFREAKRVLRKNGLLLIATPNPSGIPAKILGKKWQGHRYDHISLKTPSEWREIIKGEGFKMLKDGSTGLTGFRILQKLPFALFNWIPMVIWGFFPWDKGESYMAVARKISDE
ncbi:MAG: class I SAM-dependent methyltransferase [Candidatus Saganbacteria bacterium]|nr:class I SAM-dependent methyltransferase [Candidatus Saganbacteria bacterium]